MRVHRGSEKLKIVRYFYTSSDLASHPRHRQRHADKREGGEFFVDLKGLSFQKKSQEAAQWLLKCMKSTVSRVKRDNRDRKDAACGWWCDFHRDRHWCQKPEVQERPLFTSNKLPKKQTRKGCDPIFFPAQFEWVANHTMETVAAGQKKTKHINREMNFILTSICVNVPEKWFWMVASE